MKPQVSIIIPVINEAAQLADKLNALQTLRTRCELLLVDGGSIDASPAIAKPWVDQVLLGPRGRAKQMNLGAQHAQAEVLLFLHADTQLPDRAIDLLVSAVAQGTLWGRFDVQFDSDQTIFKLIARLMNLRSRLTGIATGDQAIFLTREAFQKVAGFPEIALMEDIALSSALKRIQKPSCLNAKVTTSARRWQQHGILRTILLMWCLRLRYFFGANPDELAARYYRRQ